jgi:hypothetical protein
MILWNPCRAVCDLCGTEDVGMSSRHETMAYLMDIGWSFRRKSPNIWNGVLVCGACGFALDNRHTPIDKAAYPDAETAVATWEKYTP